MPCNGIFTYKPLGQKRFGNLSMYAAAHTGQDFDYRFSTRPCNGVLSTYGFAYREYAPDTGRWLSQDPIFERGGYNLYAYCGNDPVNGYDPLGLLKVYPVGNSPNSTFRSDFWFAVYLEFEKGDGPWLIIRKEIKEDLCDCNSASVQSKPDNPPRKDFLEFSVSSASSWRHISDFEINGKHTLKRPYFELARLPNYDANEDKKGEVYLKFTVGVTRRPGTSVKYEKNIGASYSIKDKDHGYVPYYKDSEDFDFNFTSSATLEMKLELKCGNIVNPNVIKKTGFSLSANMRLDKDGQERLDDEGGIDGIKPISLFDWHDGEDYK